MPFPELKLHDKVNYQFPAEGIDDVGAGEVNKFLSDTFGATLPDDWNFDWVVHRGAISGTFPRRVTTWLYKTWGIKATAGQVSEIGNIASRHTIRHIPYLFDIDDTLDWRRGTFGDDGSCFWSSRAGARVMLRKNHCLAIRFYNVKSPDRGLGRAWIARLEGKSVLYDKAHIKVGNQEEIQTNCVVVFNGYGFHTGALQPARIMAGWLGMSYKQIQLRNEGEQGGVMWINEEGRGYIVGPAALIDNVDYVDLQYDQVHSQCHLCHEYIDDDDENWMVQGNVVCSACFDESCFECENCGDAHFNTAMYTVRLHPHEESYWCRTCLAAAVGRGALLHCSYPMYEHWVSQAYGIHQYADGGYICSECLESDKSLWICPGCSRVMTGNRASPEAHCDACRQKEDERVLAT